ncbi:MAG: LCCL domain-containing protein [Paracoccaceae bacterium]
MKSLSFVSASILALTLGAGAAHACPDWTGHGEQLTYGAAQLVGGQATMVVAGGDVDLSQCNIPGATYGHVITSPDFDLSLTDNPDGQALILSVQGECDTILLVNDAAGTWHFGDDTDGSLDPSIIIPAAPVGAYDIWVGTFGAQTCNATLSVAMEGGEGDEPPAGKPGLSTPPAPAILPDPGNMMSYRGQSDAVMMFNVTGSNSGTIWGSGVYTDDSPVAVAAVHAGVLQVGETGVVTVAVVGGQPGYPGVMSNGIQSSNYGRWDGSYQFLDDQGNPISVEAAPAGGASK